MEKYSEEMKFKQRYLGNKGLIAFLVLLSAFVPLSTDLYLPALPTMADYFGVTKIETNLTLILFFIFFSFATLVWGPLSDKFGRRPILITGLLLYTAASLLCAIAGSIYQLMLFRVLQAIGAGAATATATAIVKDVYDGRKRESVLAVVQSMVVISPAIAPVLGALILRFTSWRGAFIAQVIIGVLVVIGALAFRETIVSRSKVSVLRTFGRLGFVLKNKKFTAMLFIFMSMGISFMAFISMSSYIYQDNFGLSSQVYSYFFAFNAMGMMVGPLIYIQISRYFKRFTIITASYIIAVVSGILICTIGLHGPWIFALSLLPATIMGSLVRPATTFLMLEAQQTDTGSAASLMSAGATIMGSFGMIIASLNLGNLIIVIGALNIIFGLLCGTAWLFVTNRPFLGKLKET